MTLDAKVLEAAENAFAPQLSDDMKAHLHRAIERAIMVANLVPRKTLDANTLGHMVDEKLFHLEAERDEARKEAETQGRQLAALREALEIAYDTIDDADDAGEIYTLLQNTAEAAAQWVRVPEGRVIVSLSAAHGAVKLGRDFYKNCGTSPCLYPDWLRELGVYVDNALAAAPVAKGEAGEPEGK